ncbi:hypothetical protein BJ508DRAFT_331796 [Ascobolus immersus RN42]|uniref:PIN domain-containing protein n=1 Tax=Ascobolus immersus RN42 TaxID=1160509 RepID=A0A3N4HPZ5_ASCIM|nr:hypothetical protein BJ508DRAFT_331796 [Ascobolus immersus RN42]
MRHVGLQQTTTCERDPSKVMPKVLNTDRDAQAEKLASMYLTHQVKELQARVEEEKTLQAPTKQTLECVIDETALAKDSHFKEIKFWVGKGTVKMTVPISVIHSLDRLKKGTEEHNKIAREAIRWIERFTTGPKALPNVVLQTVSEQFGQWSEVELFARKFCGWRPDLTTSITDITNLGPSIGGPEGSPKSKRRRGTNENAEQRKLLEFRSIVNCVLYQLKKSRAVPSNGGEIYLVTDDPELKDWATPYGVRCLTPTQFFNIVEQEEADFAERKKEYDAKLKIKQNVEKQAAQRGNGRGRGGMLASPRGRGVGRISDRNDGTFIFTNPESRTPGMITTGGRGGRGVGKLWDPN